MINRFINKKKKTVKNSQAFKFISNQLRRKKFKSQDYPFLEFNSNNVLNEEYDLSLFYLIGDNWENNQNSPIAVLWGFNDWKLGFVSNYLKEYRTLFIPRKMLMSVAMYKLSRFLDNENCRLIVWGYTDKERLEKYAHSKKTPLYRMEDAFVRSASLGASHSTPCSLILDKTGFYYNSSRPSDLENILNTHNFDNDQILIKNAEDALSRLIKLGLSKYNEPLQVDCYLAEKIKTSKRIVVLGQVDSDMSIKYGNPDKWTSEKLVELAYQENPKAEIYYRPHPEIYAGYQRSKARKKYIEMFATVVSPDEPLVSFIDTIDHVYTISSLSGFEALIRKKKVTVVGTPFYSGWGLTDDRSTVERRKRKLTVTQLFAGAYLLYPRYLGNLDDSYEGLIASYYKIQADKYILSSDRNRQTQKSEVLLNHTARDIFQRFCTNSSESINNVNFRDIKKYLKKESQTSTFVLSSIIIGSLKKEHLVLQYLRSLREILDKDYYNKLLILIDSTLDLDVSSETLWLVQNNLSLTKAKEVEEAYTKTNQRFTKDVISDESDNDTNKKAFELSFDSALNYNNIESAVEYFCKLSLNGCSSKQQLIELVKLLEKKFLIEDELDLSIKISEVDLRCFNKIPALLTYSSILSNKNIELETLFNSACILISLKPEVFDMVYRQFEDIDVSLNTNYCGILKSIYSLNYNHSTNYVNYLIEISDFTLAKSILYDMTKRQHPDNVKILIAYSKLNSLKGEPQLSLSALESFLAVKYNYAVAKEYHRVLYTYGKFELAENTLKLIESRGDTISPALKIPTLLGLGRIQEAYSMYMSFENRLELNKYIDSKVLLSIPNNKQKLFVLSSYGPGDEIRFLSIYNEIISYYSDVVFTCDARLESLIRRSFPNIKIIPTQRVRSVTRFTGIENHNMIPDKNLSSIIDNNLYETISSDIDRKVLFVPDLISTFRKSKSCFPGTRVLKSEPVEVNAYRAQLPKETFLVGINWRSSLSGASRSQHYLDIETISPLFDLDNITFVNLQYDNCERELSLISEVYNAEIINIDDLDQYNDFSGVASLIECLDLVVAPCTSVIELAGALGKESLFFSNSGDVQWRVGHDRRDIWFNSISHVTPDQIGDKASLVNNICSEVERQRDKYYSERNKNISTSVIAV